MLVDILSRVAKTHPEDAFWNTVEEIMLQAEGSIADSILEAIEHARRGFDSERIAELIRVGDYDRAVELALGHEAAGDMSAFMGLRVSVEEAAYKDLARLSAGGLKDVPVPKLKVKLDTISPETVRAVRGETMKLVTEVTTATKDALKSTLEEGMKDGENPRVIARDMRQNLGLTERDAKALSNYRDELESGSKAALQRALRNRRYDGRIRRGKMTPDDIENAVEDYRKRLINHRAETVARTEAARAFTIGQQQLWEQAARAHGVHEDAIRRKWTVAPGERTCDWCKEVANINNEGVGLHEPFITPDGLVDLPPGHPRCRCTVIFDFDLEASVRASISQNKEVKHVEA